MNTYLNKTEREIESQVKFKFDFSIKLFDMNKPRKTGYRNKKESPKLKNIIKGILKIIGVKK